MPDLVLAGCRPVPLASYLKALAVLRLVGEQADSTVRGWWRDDTFVLRTVLDRDALLRFFLYDYRPTPIVAPWNGDSAFYPKNNREAIERIAGSTAARLKAYRAVIAAVTEVLAGLGIGEEGPSDKKAKAVLLETCRGRLPEPVLPWFDAAYLVTAEEPKYPPLLGTGGNDGRLDFTNNFMQRLLDVLDPATGTPSASSGALLAGALFAETTDGLTAGAVGQFLPSGAGGANAGAGFEGDSRVNPWDFVLMLEGAVMFAVAAVRRMERETGGALSYPFTVRAAGVGYPSASATDEGASRGEIWLPIWERPARAAEIKALLAEGRARVSGRTARHGVDFARAIATLGVDRGVQAFERYGLQVRNGLAYLATPLERFAVREQPGVRLLDEVDEWLDDFRRRATSDRAPASMRRALGRLEDAILDMCRRSGPDRVQAVLVALGGCERAMARSLRWTTDPKVRLDPVPPLSPAWVEQADDGSTEFRLAAALGSVEAAYKDDRLPLRCHLEAVEARLRRGRLAVRWKTAQDGDVVFGRRDLTAGLNAIAARRMMHWQRWGSEGYGDRAAQPARLADVAAFIEGRTDDGRLLALLWGAILVDWPRVVRPVFDASPGDLAPPAIYGLLKLCFPGAAAVGEPLPIVPRIHRLAASGAGADASRAAARRLRASGLSPAVEIAHQTGESVRRAAGAILFPIDVHGLATVRRTVLRPSTQPGETRS